MQETISRALFSFCLACFSLACAKSIPEGRDAIDAVEISGSPPQTKQSLLDGLSTKATPTFLGIKGVYDYTTLDEAQLAKDIERIERELRRRGYYEARVIATRVIFKKEQHLRVELEIDPGEPILIRSLKTTGLAQLPFDAAEAALQKNNLRTQELFDEDKYEAAKQNVANALANKGYAYARVSGRAVVDLAAHSAEVTIEAKPGLRCRFGEITIEGLKELDEAVIRDIFGLKKGEPYSVEEIKVARAALFDLGVFARAEVAPDLRNPDSTEVPLTVRLEESAFRDVTLGGGVRLDTLRFAVVGLGGWTHRNFLGGLRKFSITTRPGLTLYPTNINYLKKPEVYLLENFATVRLEQPAFLESRTRGFVQAGYNVYPLLYPVNPDQSDSGEDDEFDAKAERIVGYSEITTSIGLQRNFFRHMLATTFSLNLQSNTPFNYQGSEEYPGLDPVLITYPELSNVLDFRDDPLQPAQGFYLKNSLQVAIPFSEGQVTDVRLAPEIRTFVPLDRDHRVILASRFGVGMVLANNYGDAEGDYQDPDVVADQHKKLFRAFYSGGPGSNRGYPYRRIGPQGPIGFLVPDSIDCNDPEFSSTSTCLRPLGGLTMWEASSEIRFRATESWHLVAFVDASNVSLDRFSFDFSAPHISIGPGVRYVSPVGPVRIDLGWRVPGLQKFGDPDPNSYPDISEISPYDDGSFLKQVALNILIGEDF